MLGSRRHLSHGPARGGLALAAGFLLGALLASPRLDPQIQENAQATQVGSPPGTHSAPKTRASKSRRSTPANDASFTLSPLQWSRFARRPADFAVNMNDCLPVFGYEELPPDHPAAIRNLMGQPHAAMERMVDLQAELFGWEREKVWKIRTALLDFGKELADAEVRGARIDYPAPGVIRFDLTSARPARTAAAAHLKTRLEELGGKDAARLIRMMNVEGISREMPDHYDITAREQGDALRISGSGASELISAGERLGAEDFTAARLQGRFDARVLHLLKAVDWSRLNPSTETRKP